MARPRTARRIDQQVYIANESFVAPADLNDPSKGDKSYNAGLTRVFEGDPILERCPDYFDLLEDHMAVHDRVF